jgi:hypothetical protein
MMKDVLLLWEEEKMKGERIKDERMKGQLQLKS